MTDPLISVVMIAKDEDERIASCVTSLGSLTPLVGEVCVYDTGSTDNTITAAREAGARVTAGYWDDDFARARNCAAQMATCEWLLVVDADEELATVDLPAVAQALTGAASDADVLTVTVYVGDEVRRSWASPRLYRRQRARYVRPIHTHLARTDGSPATVGNLPPGAIALRNHGFSTGRLHRSWERVERITTREIADPATPPIERRHALIDRGRARKGRGANDGALADLAAAAAMPFTGYDYDLWGLAALVELLLDERRTAEAVATVQVMEGLAPGLPLTRWWLGHCLAASGRLTEAFEMISPLTPFDGEFGVTTDAAQLAQTRLLWAVDAGDLDRTTQALRDLSLAGGGAFTPVHGRLLARLTGSAE